MTEGPIVWKLAGRQLFTYSLVFGTGNGFHSHIYSVDSVDQICQILNKYDAVTGMNAIPRSSRHWALHTKGHDMKRVINRIQRSGPSTQYKEAGYLHNMKKQHNTKKQFMATVLAYRYCGAGKWVQVMDLNMIQRIVS